MRTTVTLDENLVRELVKFSHAKTKTAAVALAVKEQIRRAKLKKLAGLLGTVDVDEKAIKESNKADMMRAQLPVN
ncbi:MAG: type II toxin-antitoxin system VapB family antitoxin [Deltaproteobacteria bacterium]|nr:type II toxin-antitoxin system VapB family antitoxin [Deltaproteobacteria bacterium]